MFISPVHEFIKLPLQKAFKNLDREKYLDNIPINAEHIVYYKKSTSHYDDIFEMIPAIDFYTVGGGIVKWYFTTEDSRDRIYKELFSVLKGVEII